MQEVPRGGQIEVDFWNEAITRKIEDKEWADFYEGRGFRAGVDYPTSAFYRLVSENEYSEFNKSSLEFFINHLSIL